MARINKSKAMQISQAVSRANNIAKRGSAATPESIIIAAELKKYIEKKAPQNKKEVLGYLYNRMVTEGDDFQKITGMGEYNELLIGIHLGLFETLEDIEKYQVFDSVKHESSGDFKFRDTLLDRDVDLQAKGMNSSFRISPKARLELDDRGRVVKESSLLSAVRAYVNSSPRDIRFGLPIFHNANQGFFDLGSESFLQLAKLYPGIFSFSLNKSSKAYSKYDFLFRKTTEQIVEELLQKTDTQERMQSEIGQLIRVRFSKDEENLKKRIREKIEKARKVAWKRWGVIRIGKYSAVRIANDVNPLINTGINRYESHEPFYSLLKKLYSGGSTVVVREQYLSESYTLSNKMPSAYYENTYHNIRY